MIKEISPVKQLRGVVTPPADKSIAQRAAIFALLHDGMSIIRNYPMAQDPQSTLQCVEKLGAEIVENGPGLVITGRGRHGLNPDAGEIYCGNSGTAMRLLAGVIAGSGIYARLTGDASLSSRTMTRIITPLRRMGAKINAVEDTFAPLEFSRHKGIVPIEFELPVASAQLKSCVLLAGLFGEIPTHVIEKTPSRDHTERLLGLPKQEGGDGTVISSSVDADIPAQSYTIPGDFSSAAFWLAAGAIHPDAEIQINDAGLNPTRNAFLNLLKQMGADIRVENERLEGAEPVGNLAIKSSELKAIDVGRDIIPNCIDELPVLALAMAHAEGISTISGAEELRHKETDRIMAISTLLGAIGADYTEKSDGFIIRGNPGLSFQSAEFESFHDHRIAMAAAVLALTGKQPSKINDAECAAVSYLRFWDDLDHLAG